VCHWLRQCRVCVLPFALAKPVAHTLYEMIMSRNFRPAHYAAGRQTLPRRPNNSRLRQAETRRAQSD